MTKYNKKGIIALCLIFAYIIILLLKGIGIITLSWLIILAPILVYFGLSIILAIIAFIVLIIKGLIKMFKGEL